MNSHDRSRTGAAEEIVSRLAETVREVRVADLRRDDRVGMVGHFRPLVAALRTRVRSLAIYERVERATGQLRPQEEALSDLQRCEVALVTATSIINHTVDRLLEGGERP